MTNWSAWLAVAAVAVVLWIGFLVLGALSGGQGLREALTPNRTSVSADGYLEQHLGDEGRR